MKKINILILLLLTILLSACLPSADDPKTVTDKYWQQLQNNNLKEAEKFVMQTNQQAMQTHKNHITSDSQLQSQPAKSIVSTTITTTNPTTGQVHRQSFDTVLVLVDGQWKINLSETEIPPPPSARQEELEELAEKLNQSMQKNMESLDEAIDQGMDAFNEAFKDGSKEMGDSLLHMMNELNRSMKESIERLKQRRQQQLNDQQQNQLQQPDPSKGEGRI